MRILVTGAFGNIGTSTIEELLKRNHDVTCFDIKTKTNTITSQKYEKDVSIVWGDLREPRDLAAAVFNQDAVIHLGFIIPALSTTGISSEAEPNFAREVNIGGTSNLINVMKAQRIPPKLLFASSLHVYGRTHDQPPPRTVHDIPQPIEHYAKHKLECERMVKETGLNWAIFRLGASLPVRLLLNVKMFDVPLSNRIEFVHRKDVALAFANALECDEVWQKTWLIGGGPRCQLLQRDLVNGILNAIGIGALPEEAFTDIPYPTDWLDTRESQRVLKFQRRTLQDYIQDVKNLLGFRLHFIRLFRPIIRAWLLSKSPVLGNQAG